MSRPVLRSPVRPRPASARPAPALAALLEHAARLGPLPGLGVEAYARGHARFEARSDQRALLTARLGALLAGRRPGPVRVLSVGAGDGTVDAALAAVLAARGPVRFDAVEPHAASAAAWRQRVGSVPGVRGSVQVAPFAAARLRGRYDVVLAVHSLYYVGDLRRALRRATGLLPPGGRLVVLHAGREPLNALADALTTVPQPWSPEVGAALRALGAAPVTARLAARLDLADADDDVLDFTVQRALPAALRPRVRDALAELRLPVPGLVVPHPLDAFVVTAT